MSAYEEARDAVGAAIGPVFAYCQRMHETGDASDKAQAGRFAHVTRLDALVDAVVSYGAAAEAERFPCSPRIAALAARIQQLPAYQAASHRPDQLRAAAGALSSHCLPIPFHARPI